MPLYRGHCYAHNAMCIAMRGVRSQCPEGRRGLNMKREQFHDDREAYCLALWDELAVFTAIAGFDCPERDTVRIGIGFTSGGNRRQVGNKGKLLSEVWAPEKSADGKYEVIISPVIGTPEQVAANLQAAQVGLACAGKNSSYRQALEQLGFKRLPSGDMEASAEYFARIKASLDSCGEYPHGALDADSIKKQGTRLLKACCAKCGYTVRLTQKWVNVGAPYCGVDLNHGRLAVE